MKRLSKSYTSGAALTTGFAASVTGVLWTPTTASPTDGLAHLLTITGLTATNHSAKTALVTGTDENGAAQTEILAALPNGTATVTSTKYWLSITSVVPSATIGADTMKMGWAAASLAAWVPVANYSQPGVFNLGFVVVPTAGAPTYTVQSTYNDSYAVDHATVAAVANSVAEGAYTAARSSIRVAFAAAGSVDLVIMAAHL